MISTSKSPIKIVCIYSWRVIGNAYFDIWKPAIQYHYGTKTDKVSMMIYCEELNLRASIHQPMSYHATRPIHFSRGKASVINKVQVCVLYWEHHTIGGTPSGVELLDERKRMKEFMSSFEASVCPIFPLEEDCKSCLPTKLSLNHVHLSPLCI